MIISQKNFEVLFRSIFVFVGYLFYTKLISTILKFTGIDNGTIQMIFADLVFLLAIVFIYRKNLKENIITFKNDYKISKKVTTVLFWSLIILVINVLFGIFSECVFPSIKFSINENPIYNLYNSSVLYVVFKTVIFAVIAEELVFKKALRDVLSNDIMFILISGIIYSVINVIYLDLSQTYMWLDMIGYFLFALVTSIAYVKNKDNIIVIMLIKLVYSIIPLILLIVGVGDWYEIITNFSRSTTV